MQDKSNENHRQPAQPLQAPPSLLPQVLGRIRQAEQYTEDPEYFSTAFASADWTRRVAALERLMQSEKELALPWLERALSDPHPSVRAWAVHALGQHQAFASLQPALFDADWQVREAALLALKLPAEPLSPDALPDNPPVLDSTTPQRALYEPAQRATSGGKHSMYPTDPTYPPFSPNQESLQIYQEQEREARLSRPPYPQRSPQSIRGIHLLSLAAAFLLGCVLTASAFMAYSSLRYGGQSQPNSNAIATPLSAAECANTVDSTEQALCLAGEETRLNITRDFAGHKITFVRAYADTSRFILIYKTVDSPTTDTISFLDLQIQPNLSLQPDNPNGVESPIYEEASTHLWYYMAVFTVQNVPTNTKTIQVEGIKASFTGYFTELRFDTPFHALKSTLPGSTALLSTQPKSN